MTSSLQVGRVRRLPRPACHARLPDWSAGGLLRCSAARFRPCVVSFSKVHEHDTHGLCVHPREHTRSILVRHVRHARFPCDLLAISSGKLLPWKLSLFALNEFRLSQTKPRDAVVTSTVLCTTVDAECDKLDDGRRSNWVDNTCDTVDVPCSVRYGVLRGSSLTLFLDRSECPSTAARCTTGRP